jgi:hypothetical protein
MKGYDMGEVISSTVYFTKPGKENTDRVLELAAKRAADLGISSVLVATTTGYTGIEATKKFPGKNVVSITHSTGFKAPNEQELTAEQCRLIEDLGGKVLTTTHAFGGVNRAVRKKLNTYQVDEIIAFTLRIFGEGMKVVAEIALMAADAGLTKVGEPTLVISGTGRGADTAVILLPAHAQSFFDLKIVEVICMPSPFHPA